MTSFTNDDLYQMLLHRLRKDRKGSVNPEEFESFLRWRNQDFFNKELKTEGINKGSDIALKPFYIPFETLTITYDSTEKWYSAALSGLTYDYARWINVWYTTATDDPVLGIDKSGMVKVDVISEAELPDRMTNAITAPSTTYPIGHFTNTVLNIHGIAATGTALVSYYKNPTDPVYDYYTNAYGTVTYLTQDQAGYLLQAGEVARDGSVAGEVVTSTSKDLEWDDHEAVDILDMVVSDVSIALSDPGSFQASLLERKEN